MRQPDVAAGIRGGAGAGGAPGPTAGLRRHRPGDRGAWTEMSGCGRWRYALARRWGPGPGLLCVLLNPSTADAAQDDPTLRRCMARARALGFGGLRLVNLFAWRATDPAALYRAADPVGPDNDAALLRAGRWAGSILCGWGNHGSLRGRDAEVLRLLARRRLWHLGLTARGQPRHPLFVGGEVALQQWR